MKYLLVLLVIVVAFGIWRNKRRAEIAERKAAPTPALKSPQSMVACAYCGLHLPQADAVSGGSSLYYCSAEHRSLAQQSHP